MKRWELPDGWIWTTVGEVIEDGPSNGYSGPVGVSGTPTLKLSATTKGRLILNEDTTKRLEETIPPGSNLFLCPGDMLIQRANSLEYIGATAIYDGPLNAYVYPDLMMRIRVGTKILEEYLWYWLNFKPVRRSMSERATGTAGGMPKINGKTLTTTSVPLPPLPEQKRIVNRLNALQARIQRARADLAELRELAAALKRSALDAAFRGELTATWRAEHPDAEPAETLLERLRVERRRRWEAAHPKKTYVPPKPIDPAGLPELPEGWCWAALEEIATSSLGKMLDKNKNHGTLRPYLRNQNVRWRRFDLDDVGLMRFEEDEEARFGLRADDVLVCEGGEPGRAAVWGEQRSAMRFQKALHRVRCSRYLLPDWLVFQLAWHAETGLLQEYCTGTGIAHLTGESLARVPIALPPEAEQVLGCRRLTSTWDTWERAIETTHALSDDLTTTEHALLTAAFRGDLVPQHPDDEPADALLKRLQAQAAAEEGRRRRR